MARQGSSRSPVMAGGGSIFGPKPRDYSLTLPAKVRRLARKSALSIKAKEGQIRVVEDFSFEAPKTREMATVLKALGLDATKTLLLLPKSDPNVVKSGRNIPTLSIRRRTRPPRTTWSTPRCSCIQKSAVEVLQNTFKN